MFQHLRNRLYDGLIDIFVISGMLAVFASVWWIGNQPDQHYRETPKFGDILVVNYHTHTQDTREAPYPIRMAKLIDVNDKEQHITVKLGKWAYKRSWDIWSDYFNHRDGYASYYYKDTISLPIASLTNLDYVLAVRRRIADVNIEKAHTETEFKKSYASVPRI